MAEEYRLYESEYRFMDLIWRSEPVRSTELARLANDELDWKKSTCFTVLKKLEKKGFVCNENATVTARIARGQVQKYESETLIDRSFGGSLPAFLNAFLKDRKLSQKEAEEIRAMIDKAAPAATEKAGAELPGDGAAGCEAAGCEVVGCEAAGCEMAVGETAGGKEVL